MHREALFLLLGAFIYKAIRYISHPLNNGNPPVAVNDSSEDDVISTPTTKYDVFLSFRGEDTRQNFASHLYKGLCDAGIHTFIDDELHKGEKISPALLRTIEESQISMIIFSENYANSRWCMDELVHILECREKFGRVVIPIFYNVAPSNIRHQTGSFGEGFNVLKKRFKDSHEKLRKWRSALNQSVDLSGWDSNSIRPEFKFIEEIVEDVLSKLKYKPSPHLEGLVGIARHIINIEKLLTEARILGIWGMGGVGKTTLAKATFQVLRANFDAFSFIENVKGQLERISLDELQRNCLKELLKDKDITMYDIQSTFVKSRLGRKKVLLILDDVDNSKIMEDLTKVCNWFGEGSRIIITSRDKEVLTNAFAFSTYHVPDMDFYDAIHLFSLKAFKQHEPFEGYMELSKSVVKYCQGNPLALVVLGCFLCGREKKEWESALVELNKDPHKDIIQVLRLSFDSLDDKQQNVFLDLAFLINEGVYISLNLTRQLYDSSALIHISVLRDKSLISFGQNGCIVMHDLVKKMGLKISRQQLYSDVKTPVRLWRHEDIDYFFSCGKELEAIRCMSLDVSKIKRITLRASILWKMHNVIFLKFYKSDRRKPSMLNIIGVLNYFPIEMRFLSWEECPLPYVSLHFCAENLVTLEMPNSNIRQLRNGSQHFPNLKEIDLSYSKHLIALPDLSHAPKLEDVNLDGCVSLAQIRYSTIPRSDYVELCLRKSGAKKIKFGGSMKGTSSGLRLVYYYLDLDKLSLNKVRMKVFVSGKNITGVGFKHVVEEKVGVRKGTQMRKGTQSLASSLPFVERIEWLEDPIVCGDDFNQHYTYRFNVVDFSVISVRERTKERGDRGEGSNDDQVVKTLMKVEEEEEEEELTMEYCGSDSNKLTRMPKSITRWSLLKVVRVKESDINIMIGNGGGGCRYKTQLDVTFSLPHIPAPTSPQRLDFRIYYSLEGGNQQRCFIIQGLPSYELTNTEGFPDSIYHSVVLFCSGSLIQNALVTVIERKCG